MADTARIWRLARAVARQGGLADLLPELHEQAVRVSGGRCSVLLRLNSRSGQLLSTSAVGLDHLDLVPWLADAAGRTATDRVWTDGGPVVFADLPELNRRLHSRAAIVSPLVGRSGHLGLLVVGIEEAAIPDAARTEMAAVADLMAMAIERERLHRDADLQQDMRDLVADLSRAISSSLHLSASLEVFCDRARRLFTADRVSIWLHDRRARALELVASSDAVDVANRQRIPTDKPDAPISMAMRSVHAQTIAAPDHGAPDVLVPLRGRRRALGTLALDRVRIEPGEDATLLDRLEEIARQLSSAIENLWLLEDVLRSRRELESTFNSLADLVVVSDRRLTVTHINHAFAQRLGRPPEQIVEQSIERLFGRDVVDWVRDLAAPRFGKADTRFETREIEDETLGGTFLFTLSPLSGRDDEPVGIVIVARDITDQARLEAERAELRDRLTQSEKLAALGQFVAGIAHELNNPLQGVLGHVELLLHDATSTPARFKKDLKVVFREADRAAKIVHNLLVFAGSRRITRRRLNLSLVVSRVLALRATACAASGIEVIRELDPKLPRVAGDGLLLQQALLNIIINSEQALAGQSTPRQIRVRTRRLNPRRVELQISDSGAGIPPEALPRLFEPFFTTKDVGQGTGLGLAIAYGIVQEHGGVLQAANGPNGGAVFTLELPSGANAVE